MKRLTACILALLTLCLALAGCSERGRKNAAFRVINQNIVELTSTAKKILETGKVPEDVSFLGVEDIMYSPPGWVGFQTGGRGSAEDNADAAYCGFYYSPEDKPLGVQGVDMELIPDEKDDQVWTWQGGPGSPWGDSSHRYYTARIQQWWFYYEIYL